ncbi:MAG TPA: M67 family metallopeptidase [Rhodothermales bacterium]
MRILPAVLRQIRAHGEATYPEECCGFLLGRVVDGVNHVTASHAVTNRRTENRERRYQIEPGDYLAASRTAEERNLDIVGFYHSHPDHPARPSETDLAEATFPGFTYVIVSVRAGQSAELTGWSLASDRSRFESESVEELSNALENTNE